MIEFIAGIITACGMVGVGYVGFMLGKRQSIPTEPPKLSEVEKQKYEKLAEINEGMNKVLNYSEADARKHYRG